MAKIIKFTSKFYSLQPQPMAPDPKPIALELLTPTELCSLYNVVASNLERGPVKRFADKVSAVRRTWGILEDYERVVEAEAKVEPTPPSPAPDPRPEEPKAKVERKKRGMRFVFPAEDAVKPIRADSARGKALAVLEGDGGTFEQVQKVTGWNEKQAYEGIRLLHYYSGYGLTHPGDSIDPAVTKIKVFTKPGKK